MFQSASLKTSPTHPEKKGIAPRPPFLSSPAAFILHDIVNTTSQTLTRLSPFPHGPATRYKAGHLPPGTFWSVGSVTDVSASVPIGFPFSVWKYLVFPGVLGPNL